MIRKIVQLLLCAVVLPFYPWVLILTASIFTPKFWSEAASFTLENWGLFLIYPAAAIGIPALVFSILVAPAAIKRTRWLCWLVSIGLIAGSLTAVTFLSVATPSQFEEKNWSSLAMTTWQMGGPLLVAFWNLGRLWREKTSAAETAS